MTFELAALVVVCALAVVLALVCYHLLGRLEMLERAVQGGLTPPTTRLTREQFERRFRTAHARSTLAREIGTGIVVVVGAEHGPDGELASTLDHLPRRDLLQVRNVDDLDADRLGVTTTPFLFVIDDRRIRTAQPVGGSGDVIDALERFA